MKKNCMQGAVCIGITTVLFSLMEVVLKFISNDLHPVQITFSRFLVGGLVLVPFAMRSAKKLKQEGRRIAKNDLLYCLVLGIIGVAVSMTFYQLAVFYSTASAVAILFSSNPLFVFVLAFFILHHAITVWNVAAVILDIAGILCVIEPWNTQINQSGVIFAVLAALIFALYSVLSKPKCNKLGSVIVTCTSFIFGSLVLLALILLGHIGPVGEFLSANHLALFADVPVLSGYTVDNIAIVFFVYVIVTGVGYASYFTAVEKLSANTASLVFFFKPVLAPVFAFLILQERMSRSMIAGIVLILAGSLLNIFFSRNPGQGSARVSLLKRTQ